LPLCRESCVNAYKPSIIMQGKALVAMSWYIILKTWCITSKKYYYIRMPPCYGIYTSLAWQATVLLGDNGFFQGLVQIISFLTIELFTNRVLSCWFTLMWMLNTKRVKHAYSCLSFLIHRKKLGKHWNRNPKSSMFRVPPPARPPYLSLYPCLHHIPNRVFIICLSLSINMKNCKIQIQRLATKTSSNGPLTFIMMDQSKVIIFFSYWPF
jgi:hypothetical protein